MSLTKLSLYHNNGQEPLKRKSFLDYWKINKCYISKAYPRKTLVKLNIRSIRIKKKSIGRMKKKKKNISNKIEDYQVRLSLVITLTLNFK